MTVTILSPRKALNKSYLKVKPQREDIERFKANLIRLLDEINEKESEEFHKNIISEFLKNTYYAGNHYINTKGRNDLVIHNGKDAKTTVGVIVEAKKPSNKSEMVEKDGLNAKAFQELVLYYLRERITHNNLEIRYLLVTNIYEWFIFDVEIFEKAFAQNKNLVKQFQEFEEKRLAGTNTDFFYKEIAEPAVEELLEGNSKAGKTIEFTHFDIREYDKILRNNDKADDNKLIALFKLLSPEHLLKLPFKNDSNSLDKTFYAELLHIIGLTEIKDGGKKLIDRKESGKRDAGSIIENAINQLHALDKISRLDKPTTFGKNDNERYFNVGLELVITWINRILFLKLLEAQLITYHKGDKDYSFLNKQKIKNFDDLNTLFFQVLAREVGERDAAINNVFGKVPYLNSSLFEPTDLEHACLFISQLQPDKELPIISGTVLKDNVGKKRTGKLNALEYLFAFLDAYDFSSEGSEEIQEENKTLISASVLGLIFEKINGYKDGSFFTPGFITMYMCRETIRRAVVEKFNDNKKWNCKTIDDLYDKIDDKKEANQIINGLKICDPAVGSGHFLVSALNEIIAIKSDLKILVDRHGKSLRGYHIEVSNDELTITDEDGVLFEYNPKNKESQRIQEALFHEKQALIENSLFGVDINTNSVKICRLRLWIELLKNAYYKAESNNTELETLPNIDINIKCGNSLISRFPLDVDLSQALKKSKITIKKYREAVQNYRHATSKEQKREMEQLIAKIKGDFRTEISNNDPKVKRLNSKRGERDNLLNQHVLFELGKAELKERSKKIEGLTNEIDKLSSEIEEIKSNKIYENAFEWRFEFPEVLTDEGTYSGFDLVIGNPPYISNREMHKKGFQSEISFYNKKYISAKSGNYDIYIPFIEKGLSLINNNKEISFILPNKFIIAKYSKSLLETIQKEYHFLNFTDLSTFNVFEEASVYPIIIRLLKNKSAVNICDKISITLENNYLIPSEIQKWDYINHSLIGSENTPRQKIIKKIEGSQSINSELQYSPGINGFQFTNYGTCVTEGKSTKTAKRLVVTGGIDRYTILSKKTRYRGVDYQMPFMNNNPEIISEGKWKLFSTPKIIVAGMTKHIEAALDEEGEITPGVSVYNILGPVPKLKYTLGILNSKLIDWYFKIRFQDKHLAGGYISMNAKLLEKIVIKNSSKEDSAYVERLVTKILALRNKNETADISKLEEELDKKIYEIYGLTAPEIKMIEENTNE